VYLYYIQLSTKKQDPFRLKQVIRFCYLITSLLFVASFAIIVTPIHEEHPRARGSTRSFY